MTRSELIKLLSQRFPQLHQKDTELSVKIILTAISATLASGGRIEIRGFGSFNLNYRPPRIARNPKTGETFPIEGKYAPHFRTGQELRDIANKI